MNEFVKELTRILNRQYPNHHFDCIFGDFVNMALVRSGYTLIPPSSLTSLPPDALGGAMRETTDDTGAGEDNR